MDMLTQWSIAVAQAVAPDEVDIAPFITQAFMTGEKERTALFRTFGGGGPGGFGAGEVQTVFPLVLQTVAATGALLCTILSSPAADTLLAAVNTLIKVKEVAERDQKRKHLPDHPYGALKQVLDDFSTGLKATKLSQEQRDLMAYKFMQTLLADPKASQEVVQRLQVAAKPKHGGKR